MEWIETSQEEKEDSMEQELKATEEEPATEEDPQLAKDSQGDNIQIDSER